MRADRSSDPIVDEVWVDDLQEDKHLRIRHELEAGDVIAAVCNVTHVVGADASR